MKQLLSTLILLILVSGVASASSPFDPTGFKFKQAFTVESPSSATEYEFLLDLNSTTIGKQFLDNVKDDFSDLRIVDSTETIALDYWVVTGSVTPDINGHVWFDANVVSGDNNFFIYYGNPAATTLSDFNSVFNLFDDHSDGNFLTDPEWAVQNGSWEVDARFRLGGTFTAGNAIDSNFTTPKELIKSSALASVNYNHTDLGGTSNAFLWVTSTDSTCTGASSESVKISSVGQVIVENGAGFIALNTENLDIDQDIDVVVYKDEADRFYAVIGDLNFYGASTSATNLQPSYESVCVTENTGGNPAASFDNFFFSQATLEDTNTLLSGVAQSTNFDVNVVSPNGGELIKVGSTQTVSFLIQADSNSALIDANFSTSNVQGTGQAIINDVNTDSATITCVDSDFSDPTSCSFSWDTTGVADNNYFILINASVFSTEVTDESDGNFVVDGTAPTIVAVFPDLNFSTKVFPLDFNATIDDGVGTGDSGNFRCITRVFFNDIHQPILDTNVNGTSGLCERSISSGVPNDTNVSVGFRAVDNVGNVSNETITDKIFFDPVIGTVNELCIQISDDLRAAGGCIDDRGFEDTITSSSGLFILETGDQASLLLLFVAIGILSIIIAGIIFIPKSMKPKIFK